MKILIGAEPLMTSLRTGIPIYTWHLFNGLLSNPEVEKLFTFKFKLNNVKDAPTHQTKSKSRVIDFFLPHMEKFPRTQQTIYRAGEILFQFLTKKITKDALYHEPNFIVKPYSGSCTTTLHDLSCLRFPEFHKKETIAWFEKGLKRTLTQCDHFIAVSEFSRQEAIHYLGIPSHKISTITSGVEASFKPRSQVEIQSVLNSYGLKFQQYILSVCTLEPRKNIDRLIEAYMLLPKKIRANYPLVLIGRTGWKSKKLVEKIERLVSHNEIKKLGYVPLSDLYQLYSGAKGFAYVSLYEGFGLPVLEAMASGIPVITSKNTAMAEFSKNALLVEPSDIDDIKSKLENLLENKYFNEVALINSSFYKSNFTWEKCVADTFSIMKNVMHTN